MLADAILSNAFPNFLSTLASPPTNQSAELLDEPPNSVLAFILERIIIEPPRTWTEESKTDLIYAVRVRYNKLGTTVPNAVHMAMFLIDLMESQENRLVRLVQRTGPRGTSSVDACKEMLQGAETRDIAYPQVANVLLFMVISHDGEAYDPGIFVEALRQHSRGRSMDWTDVVSGFDRDGLRVTKKQFLSLYNALLPLAREYDRFDIQALWGGSWNFPDAQLSFVVAFLSTTRDELDVTQIPDLRRAFTEEEFEDTSEDSRAFAAQAVKHPLVSRDATEALFTMIFRSQDTYNHAQMLGIPDTLINPNMTIFVCAASSVPKPWAALQDQALKQLFYPFLVKQHDNYNFVMHSLWKHDKTWVAARMVEFYTQEHMLLSLILDHALEHGWLELLLTIQSGFVLDLATLAHSKGRVNLEEWSEQHVQTMGPLNFAKAIVDFLRTKSEDEAIVQRDHTPPTTAPLKVKTVHALLNMISPSLSDEDLGPVQRQCLQIWPRLINYGDSYDEVIDANGERSNALPEEAGTEMEDQYKRMYGQERDVREILETLRRLKESDDGPDQDLFACMIHGLFDEYNCFGEYPLEALATTAVLFGGLINYSLLSRIALQVALYMVLEAVAEYTPEDSMYKFGLQALIHFKLRLPEWPSLCERLLHIPSLQGTEIVTQAEEILRNQPGGGINGGRTNGEVSDGITNGSIVDDFPPESPTPAFSSLHVDSPIRSDLYEEPDEDTSDKVMFVLNNVSKRNLEEKFKDLQDALEEKHHQWFARYLVEELAKSQPNFQALYLQLLENFNQKLLWAEVLRETYLSCSKMLNAQTTMESSLERINLKNLATWLGSLTLARNQPILHRNISFKDLLLEAFDTQRLIVAIPFTCSVLKQSSHSKVFRPPNPWLMELLGFLAELYEHGELKLNLKFEIEVLCKEVGADLKSIEPLEIIRARGPMIHQNDMLQQYVPDSDEGFGNMHLMGLSKRPPNERFSPEAVIAALPDLASMLHFPSLSNTINQQQLRSIFFHAAQTAIMEIIAPVVERSVTIASIATSETIQKDFATEGDPDKLKNSAHTVVRALSGSLALVTCKEPLRMSITNNVRLLAARHLPEQLPEGQILMFVNDNLDTVCNLVEQAAEAQSLAEIDAQLAVAIEQRKQHLEQRPNEAFNYPPVSRWAQFIPEPYRQEPGGLNGQQLAIYEDFGRQARITPAAHSGSISQDNSRQIQDVLSDSYLPSLPTPAEAPAMPRQTPQQRMQALQGPQSQHQVNGYGMDMHNIGERIRDLAAELQRTAREASEEHIGEIGPDAPIRNIFDQLVELIANSVQKDMMAVAAGQHTTMLIFNDASKRLEIEVLAQLLRTLCSMSVQAGRSLTMYLATVEDDKIFNAPVAISLLHAGLLDVQHVDGQVSKALKQRRLVALDFLKDIVDELLMGENPGALRADFVMSFEALSRWLSVEPELEAGKQIMSKLQIRTDVPNGLPSPPESEKQDQLEYIFEEWVQLQRKDIPDAVHAAFIHQLHRRHIMNGREDASAFFRASLEMSSAACERAMTMPYGTLDNAYRYVDALAKLIVSLVTFQGETDGAVQGNKAKYLEALIVLVLMIMNHHHNTLGDRFNARVYFRLFSSLLCELNGSKLHLGDAQQEIPLIIGRALQTMQPRFFPRFAFSWLALLCHRLFVPAVLKPAGRSTGGWDLYTKLLGALFTNLGFMIADTDAPVVLQDFYRGVMRLMLMLHHDFPEFLCENHLHLNSSIPIDCVQLHNLVNSALPSPFIEQPDPYSQGLKINRLEGVRQTPNIRGDPDLILANVGIKDILENIASGTEASNEDVSKLLAALEPMQGAPVDALVVNGLVLFIAVKATVGSSVFSAGVPLARLLERLLRDARREISYHLISAMINQLRYINAHTNYFLGATNHIFTTGSEDVQQQIMRILIERMMPARPHPWGLVLTLLEMVKNQAYDIWSLPWMKTAPQLEEMLMRVAHGQQDRMPRSPLRAIM